jgi:type IV pilus assembly protein PilX
MTRKRHFTSRHSQRGATLIIALIFMVILALLGANVAGTTVLQERMAGNVRNKDLAFQAAEYALRDAEANRTDGNNWMDGPWGAGGVTAYLLDNGADHANDAPYWRAFDWSVGHTPAAPVAGSGVSSSYVIERMTAGGKAYRVTARGQAPGNADAVLQVTYVLP